LAKFETAGEACGESFFEFFLWSELACSPLPNLQGLAKVETAGEACGESFFEFFLGSELARSPLPNLQGLAKCRYPLLNLSPFAKPSRFGKVRNRRRSLR